ncbi:MAG: ActS/PrrB/RegB family redox-sensitive histidine kinase [Alphaproteobacteria bacterium]|nr:ActS/PrrB/RegB family redox-sensitive histidine kinase [Alphaproteobacteria bacterium]
MLIRWIGVIGQAVALFVVHIGFGLELPMVLAIAIVGVSALLNLVLQLSPPTGGRIDHRQATLFLTYDLLQLAALLFLTGGLYNPFAVLILAPVTISATVLSRHTTVALSVLAVFLVSVLAFWHLPLPSPFVWAEPSRMVALGLWVAQVCAIVFTASYTFAVAEEARRMSDALSATQMALAREQRVSALGGLAAAAAHELGSPLSTIAVAAKELARDVPPDSPYADDVRLLVSQSQRCSDILAQIAHLPEEADPATPFERLPISALVELAALPYEKDDIEVDFRQPAEGGDAEPVVPRTPELLHGLGTLIQNAVQFAKSRVAVETSWDQAEARIAILDDGPGFSPMVLAELGEPYVSSRSGGGGHMGLGVFIALSLLDRGGAAVAFDNRPEGGARVVVRWDRAILEGVRTP